MLYFAVPSSAMVTTAETLKYCSGDYQLANKKTKKKILGLLLFLGPDFHL
jgi:hypothetical protein